MFHHVHSKMAGNTIHGNHLHHFHESLHHPGNTIHGYHDLLKHHKVGGNVVVPNDALEAPWLAVIKGVRRTKGMTRGSGMKNHHSIEQTIKDVHHKLHLKGSGNYGNRPAYLGKYESDGSSKGGKIGGKGKKKETGRGMFFSGSGAGDGLMFDHEMSSGNRRHLPKLKLSTRDMVGNGLSYY